jgi:hypothetical protein
MISKANVFLQRTCIYTGRGRPQGESLFCIFVDSGDDDDVDGDDGYFNFLLDANKLYHDYLVCVY